MSLLDATVIHSSTRDGLLRQSNLRVETLELVEVMKNPHVQQLYTDRQRAINQAIVSGNLQMNIFQENLRLNAELKSQNVELQTLKVELQSLKVNTNFLYTFYLFFSSTLLPYLNSVMLKVHSNYLPPRPSAQAIPFHNNREDHQSSSPLLHSNQ
jgi:hypothetical protein